MQKIINIFNKNCFKKSNPKIAEATGGLIGDKIADKMTSVSKKPSKFYSQNNEASDESKTPKERYIFPEKRQQIIDELR